MTFRIAPLTAAMLLTLIAINVWLLSVAIQDHDPGEQAADLKPHWVANLSGTAAELPASRPISAHGEILARPVFFKTRLPFVPLPPAPPPAPKAQPTPPSPAAVDPGLVLGGVMIDGGAKRAYLFNKGNADGTWVSEGEIIKGWKLHLIEATGVKLQQGGRTIVLQLYPTGP